MIPRRIVSCFGTVPLWELENNRRKVATNAKIATIAGTKITRLPDCGNSHFRHGLLAHALEIRMDLLGGAGFSIREDQAGFGLEDHEGLPSGGGVLVAHGGAVPGLAAVVVGRVAVDGVRFAVGAVGGGCGVGGIDPELG